MESNHYILQNWSGAARARSIVGRMPVGFFCGLLALASVATLVLSPEVAAQGSPRRDQVTSVSSAIEEARRSPFHARPGGAIAEFGLPWFSASRRPGLMGRSTYQVPSADIASPTAILGASLLGTLVGHSLVGLVFACVNSDSQDWCKPLGPYGGAALLWGTVGAAVIAPAWAANFAGASWSRSVPGSLLGAGTAWLGVAWATSSPERQLGWEAVAAASLIHAGITTLVPVVWPDGRSP